MIFPAVEDLVLVSVMSRGIANEECIALNAVNSVDLAQFGIVLAHRADSGLAKPYIDHTFWFGSGMVAPGDWVLIYTGPGEPRSVANQSGTMTYTAHWGKERTVFADSRIVPVLFQLAAATVGEPPENAPQTRRLTQET